MRAQTRRRTFHSVCRVKKKAVDGRFSLCCSPTPKWFSFFFIFPTLSHFFPPTWSANTNALIRMRVTYCSVRSYHLGEEKRCKHHSRRRRFRFECWGCTSALPFSSIIIVPDKQESTGSVRGATGPGVGGGGGAAFLVVTQCQDQGDRSQELGTVLSNRDSSSSSAS